ncbi:M23 family metallopeptidase [Bacillus sp. FJAT-45350]|uniref:M23 family metallopeptidase n=1 Tax=Bacillus sp. FJAT-45350 TaxID=2011014 RepID=UPI000BB8A50D|nr:M23 family metallopeptidase [Bacillus sp. FJAT-45350]
MRDEEKNKSSKTEESKSFNVQRFLRKRWALPAVYLGAAAIVLSAFFVMQGQQDEGALPPDEMGVEQETNELVGYDQEAIPVTNQNEVVKMPVVDENEVEVVGYFYDYEASPEEQQAALVYYNNTYYQNKGIDLAKESGESFDVTAALSGTVVKAEKDSLLGYIVQINHDNGVVTHYQSLESIEVEEGATVKQGDLLGQAGRNLYNSDAGVHLHFAIRHNGDAINPLDFVNQSIETIVEAGHSVEENAVNAEEDEEVAEDEDKEKEDEVDEVEEQDNDDN